MNCIHGDKIEEKWYNTKGCPVRLNIFMDQDI